MSTRFRSMIGKIALVFVSHLASSVHAQLTFVKIGDGVCEDCSGEMFDFITFTEPDPETCQTKCTTCEDKLPVGNELLGFEVNSSICFCRFENVNSDWYVDGECDDMGVVNYSSPSRSKVGPICSADISLGSDRECYSKFDNVPSDSPSSAPSESQTPSDSPSTSTSPSSNPSETPSVSSSPSSKPSLGPSQSLEPSASPSDSPSKSISPSSNPSETPSVSSMPSSVPSQQPSLSGNPTSQPSDSPSKSTSPSSNPSVSSSPSSKESLEPSESPSDSPSETPSITPSSTPSSDPSEFPSSQPSESPSSTPSLVPSSTPSCSPSASPTEKPSTVLYGVNLFYPEWMRGKEGCRSDGDEPTHMAVDPTFWLTSTLEACCKKWFSGYNYNVCLGKYPTDSDDCVKLLYYPDWQGSNKGCLADGKEPLYMLNNYDYFLSNTKAECCEKFYPWDLTCGGTGKEQTLTSGKFYPDWSGSMTQTCLNDGKAPGYMLYNQNHYLSTTLDTCCKKHFSWNVKKCLGDSSESVSVGSNEWYVNWTDKKCVQDCKGASPCGGIANSWDELHTSQEICCEKKLYWVSKRECVIPTTRSL